MICKWCKTEKVQIYVPRTAGKVAFNQDEKGRRWDGLKCPDCRPAYERQKRATRKIKHQTPQVELIPLPTKGKCRKCSGKLPATRYFTHDFCSPGYPLDAWWTGEEYGAAYCERGVSGG